MLSNVVFDDVIYVWSLSYLHSTYYQIQGDSFRCATFESVGTQIIISHPVVLYTYEFALNTLAKNSKFTYRANNPTPTIPQVAKDLSTLFSLACQCSLRLAPCVYSNFYFGKTFLVVSGLENELSQAGVPLQL